MECLAIANVSVERKREKTMGGRQERDRKGERDKERERKRERRYVQKDKQIRSERERE